MDEFKSNGAAKLKNALRWLVEFVRYHCLREVGDGKEEEGRGGWRQEFYSDDSES